MSAPPAIKNEAPGAAWLRAALLLLWAAASFGVAFFARELNQVVGFIDKGTFEGVVDLDIGGTAFEQKVWRVLCGIPAGKTRSYSDVARDLGVPEAVRAVAGACAANVLAIAIPCHRVVRGDGSISGYRWGVERKRALLAEEAVEFAT